MLVWAGRGRTPALTRARLCAGFAPHLAGFLQSQGPFVLVLSEAVLVIALEALRRTPITSTRTSTSLPQSDSGRRG
jgi:hypothetical protein